MTRDPANFREYAGVVAARWLIAGMLCIGPMDLFAKWLAGDPIQISEIWMSAMITMAGGAFGFLSGKQTTGSNGGQQNSAVSVPVPTGSQTVTTVKPAPAEQESK